jgi:large subunit ribosomal protein L19
MVSPAIQKINEGNLKEGVPDLRIGDQVRVHAKIYEGDKERVQVFAGNVIARKGSGATETFTVRRISHGVGVERVFPVYSPHISKIEVLGSSHVRRAKLYFLRERTGKKARLREKIRKRA